MSERSPSAESAAEPSRSSPIEIRPFAAHAKEHVPPVNQKNDVPDDVKKPPLHDNKPEDRYHTAQWKDHDHPASNLEHARQFHGTLKSVNTVHKIIAVNDKEYGHDLTKSNSLADNAKVLIGGRIGSFQT